MLYKERRSQERDLRQFPPIDHVVAGTKHVPKSLHSIGHLDNIDAVTEGNAQVLGCSVKQQPES
jgi:hypothetical protein